MVRTEVLECKSEQKLLIAPNSLENAHVSIADIWSAVTGHRFGWRGGLTPQFVDGSIQVRLRQVAAD